MKLSEYMNGSIFRHSEDIVKILQESECTTTLSGKRFITHSGESIELKEIIEKILWETQVRNEYANDLSPKQRDFSFQLIDELNHLAEKSLLKCNVVFRSMFKIVNFLQTICKKTEECNPTIPSRASFIWLGIK